MKEKRVFEKVLNFLSEAATKYENDFIANYTKWNNCGHPETINYETNSGSGNCKTQKEAAAYLREWLSKRIDNVIKIYNE